MDRGRWAYLAAARIAGQGKQRDATSGVEYDDAFLLAFDVSKANDPANVVQLPVLPVPDPVRPSHAPVDLRLEYQVLPAGGVHPTPQDLDAIGVAIRVRLDVSGGRSRSTPSNRTVSGSRSAARRTLTRIAGSSSRTAR